jgi:hypothetical protein
VAAVCQDIRDIAKFSSKSERLVVHFTATTTVRCHARAPREAIGKAFGLQNQCETAEHGGGAVLFGETVGIVILDRADCSESQGGAPYSGFY